MRILGHIWWTMLVPLLVIGASAAPARAADAAGVVVVVVQSTGVSPELAETVSRLRGELLSLGVEVVMAERPGPKKSGTTDPRTWLRREPGVVGPAAVIETVSEGTQAVDIWIFDDRRKTPVSRVALEPKVENAPGRLAIHAVEVLRANLVAIDLAARGRARESAAAVAAAPVPDTVPEDPGSTPVSRTGVAAGAGLLDSFDGVGPALLPLVRVDWTARPWLALQATVAGLGTRPTITGTTGSARLSQQYATLGACLCAPATRALGLYLALAAGVLRTAIDGQTDGPAVAHAVRRWSLLADASLGARARLPGRYYLTLAAHVQVAEPYVAIHFVDTLMATTGRPNLLVTLAVGAWL